MRLKILLIFSCLSLTFAKYRPRSINSRPHDCEDYCHDYDRLRDRVELLEERIRTIEQRKCTKQTEEFNQRINALEARMNASLVVQNEINNDFSANITSLQSDVDYLQNITTPTTPPPTESSSSTISFALAILFSFFLLNFYF
ncbi:unnamed protein product, partial [Mesorhabditis belari]|uniref:Uncharacterized protein n=1 Tax=Mesorhabditis belari TaxID=2138241 RepID=A0AAF3ENU5_9BILA